jgi:hypothetical protein
MIFPSKLWRHQLYRQALVDPLPVKLPKPMNSPMKQHAKVVAVYSKIVTNFLVVAIFKETRLEKMAIPFRKSSQDRADLIAILPAVHQFFQTRLPIHNVG